MFRPFLYDEAFPSSMMPFCVYGQLGVWTQLSCGFWELSTCAYKPVTFSRFRAAVSSLLALELIMMRGNGMAKGGFLPRLIEGARTGLVHLF